MNGKSWEKDYEQPAVEGTINVLKAAKKEPCELGIPSWLLAGLVCRHERLVNLTCPPFPPPLLIAIKNVVVTSSFAAIGNFTIPATEQQNKTYTEEDWNPVTQEDCKNMKADEYVFMLHERLLHSSRLISSLKF